jgi:hypothetical protein
MDTNHKNSLPNIINHLRSHIEGVLPYRDPSHKKRAQEGVDSGKDLPVLSIIDYRVFEASAVLHVTY